MDWIGVDGCRAGWFAAHMTTDGVFHGSVHTSIASLRDAYPERGVLIDVPIGLVADSSGGRACDREARRVLGGGRASSVFTAPTRAATRVDSYEEGSAINASLTGKKLSKQAWGIVPKIAEVDAYLLAADSSERAAVREVHPEVLFWALSGRTSMTYRKSAAEGIEERLEVLERFAPCVREAYTECLDSWPRSQVARDDVLDAFAAAVTGHLGGEHLSTLPATPEHDGHGLAMEMVYWLAGDGTRGLPSLIASGCGPPDGPSETYNAAGGLT